MRSFHREVKVSFDWQSAANVRIGWAVGLYPAPSGISLGPWSFWQGVYVHSNPRFFKYVWQVFTESDLPPHFDDTTDMKEANSWALTQPELCFSDAIRLIKQLHDEGIVMLVRNRRMKRLGGDAPWDDAKLIETNNYADRYDLDPDPAFHGHK